jgi:hypothetical protein
MGHDKNSTYSTWQVATISFVAVMTAAAFWLAAPW